MIDSRFHPLDLEAAKPEKFTYPFNYIPHPLSVAAAERVSAYVAQHHADVAADGKMFGVLVVENAQGQPGFLAAYSGLLGASNDHPYFVPAVFDMMQPHGYFKVHEREITQINETVSALENSPEYAALRQQLATAREEAEKEIGEYRTLMEQSKMRRDALRRGSEDIEGSAVGTADGAPPAMDEELALQLLRESQFQKAELRRIKRRHQERIDAISRQTAVFSQRITELRKQRQGLSDALQKWLFAQFRMVNARGEVRDLNEIFAWYSKEYAAGNAMKAVPPAGSGECCAPKLLQYAFLHALKPVCMAEFWWGNSPKGEIRHHGHYYPSCQGKCKPILTYMLQGMEVDPDPLCNAGPSEEGCCDENCCCGSSSEISTETATEGTGTERYSMEILYQDNDILVVNKPAGMLSVPGKDENAASVYSLVREVIGTEPLMVHRLDMDTSGLMVIAKNKPAHEHLQRQFAEHSIEKTYVALVKADKVSSENGNQSSEGHLDGALSEGLVGKIELPLAPDYLDRPRQKVDWENGKAAVTAFRIIGVESMKIGGPGGTNAENAHVARVELHPLTGRTHQLRVHCAHTQGLDSPIIGDPLYGTPSARMYLHASTLTFTHPVTSERLTFHQAPKF